MIDLMLEPAARAAVNAALPTLPEMFKITQVPSLSVIVSPRGLLGASAAAEASALDATLSRIKRTPAAARAQCSRYDAKTVILAPKSRPAILLFERITGFRDSPSVAAAHQAFIDMAARRHWDIVVTDAPGAMNPSTLKRFDAVVWNNVSGDVLTLSQRRALRHWVLNGGGFAGVHGTGGDPVYIWDWYPDRVIGARFIGHPHSPQFQTARIIKDPAGGAIVRGLPDSWTMNDEWYSFAQVPHGSRVRVVARLDEASYQPGSLAMGDHPIAWARCVGRGRSFYSAIGHRPEGYTEPNNVRLMEQGIEWSMGLSDARCSGKSARP
jgi:type 1 glutamine amidotransferase